jgi:hypothetical protein
MDMLTILAGFIAGALHVFMGPDHLAAVAPLSADQPRRAWHLGLRWGIGHAVGVAIIAAVAFLLRPFIHMETLSHWSERIVGVVLIGVGIWGLSRIRRFHIHSHGHEHDEGDHEHIHFHDREEAHAVHEPRSRHRHGHAAFAVGAFHGAAGSHHVVSLLPALALPSTTLAAFYLAAFALGNILGMTVFAGLIGAIFLRLRDSGNAVYRWLLGLTSTMAIGIGIWWLGL